MALDSLLDAAQLDWKETEPCARQVTIKFPQEAVAGAFDQASRETAKQAQVPGFRKGKAPLSLIKAKYKDYIADDVTRLLHQAAFSKVTSDKSADIVAFGRMDAKEAPAADREYAVTLDVEVAPEFKLPEYKGLEIKVEDGETLEQHIENRMKYLKDLYGIYNDWTLALAAYNCGPGNVNKAIRRSGKDDFWGIYDFLPRETRSYVPAYIAAAYVMNYHNEHGIREEKISYPYSLITDTIMVRKDVHFGQISSVLNIPFEQLRDLNPQYKMDMIPGEQGNYSLKMPLRYINDYISLEDSISNYDRAKYFEDERGDEELLAGGDVEYRYRTVYHKIRRNETWSSIARKYGVNVSDLKKWESQAVEQYMLKAIPYNVLIDNEGSILAFNLKTNELSDLLKELTGSRGFEIKGSFAGLDEGVMTLKLLLKDGKKERMTTKIVNGLFEFSGSVDMVCTGIITLPSRLGELSFFLGNENIEISGDVKDLDNVRISGSESNDEFLQIADMCNRKKNPMQCLMNYVLDNPQSIYSPLIISSYLAPYLNTNELREIVLRLDGQAKLTFQYDMLLKHLEELDKNEKIGQKVKDFVLNDSNGKPVSLSQFVSKNKCTLIYFWASWDNMSRLRNKELRVLYNRYKNEGFDIIGVSLDDSRAAWTNAIEEEGLKWTNVSDLKRWNSVIVKLYELEHIPQNILVDSKGNIISRNLNFEDLNQSILLYLQH